MFNNRIKRKKVTLRGKISGFCSIFLLSSVILPNVVLATGSLNEEDGSAQKESMYQDSNKVSSVDQTDKIIKEISNDEKTNQQSEDNSSAEEIFEQETELEVSSEATLSTYEDNDGEITKNEPLEKNDKNKVIEKNDEKSDLHIKEKEIEETNTSVNKPQQTVENNDNYESTENGEIFFLQKNREMALSTALEKSSVKQRSFSRVASVTDTFINSIASSAEEVASEYGLYASVMIAQAALESNWGRSSLATAPNYNLFGIKGTYRGSSVTMPTYEYSNEKGWYQIDAAFRKYPSVKESLMDNANLLMNGVTHNKNIYYGSWIENTQTYKSSTEHLEGIYATDPNYNTSLNTIIALYNLEQYDIKTSETSSKEVNGTVQLNSNIENVYSRPTTFYNSKKASLSFLKSLFGNDKSLTFNVNEEISTKNGIFYSLYKDNKFIGWIDSNDLKNFKTYEEILATNNINYAGVIINPNYSIDSKPYGTMGFELIGYSKDHVGQKVNIEKEIVTSRGTFSQIAIKGKTVWIDKRALKKESVISSKDISYMANVSRSGFSIDSKPYGIEGYNKVSTSTNYLGKTIKATQEKKTQRGVFLLINVNSKEVGWIDKRALDIEKVITTNETKYSALIIRENYSIDSKPYGVEGYKNISKSKNYLNSKVTVSQEKQTQRGTFAYIRIDGKVLGWIDIKALEKIVVVSFEEIIDTKEVSYVANITNSQYSIDTKPYGTSGYKFIDKSANHIGVNVRALEEKTTQRGTFVRFVLNGSSSWIDKRALDIEAVISTNNISYVAEIKKHKFSLDTKPYGTVGFKNISVSSKHIDKQVKALQEKKTRRGTFVLITSEGNKLGWIDKKALLIEVVIKKTEKNYTAKIANGKFSIDTKPYGVEGFSFIEKAQTYLENNVEVNQEIITSRGTFAHINIDGEPLGWLDIKALGSIVEKVISTKSVVYVSKINRPNYSIDSSPYGTKDFKSIATSKSYINEKAIASQEKITQRGTFVLIKANGKVLGWIDKRALKIETVLSEKTVSYHGVISKSNYSIDTKPYGTEGFNLISYSNSYLKKKVTALKEKTTQRGTFVLINVNHVELGWIDKNALTI